MSWNSQRFLQFHPTIMLVSYVNFYFIIIRQNVFLGFFFLSECVKILVRPRAGFPPENIFVVQTGMYIREGFHEDKREWGWTFYFKTR